MSPWPPLQGFYRSYHAILSLYLTNLCNLRCRHCGTDSGPTSRRSLRIDDDVLAELSRTIRGDGIKMLHISGGEPFLRRPELAALSELARSEGIPMAVNTNGFWAPTVARGIETLEKMPGITQLALSTDTYHSEWLAVDRVVQAARAGVECGRLVDVFAVTPFARRDDFAVALDERLASAGLLDRVRRFNVPLGPTGRAEPLPEEDLAPWQDEPPTGACTLLNRPTILENGSVFACCNTPVAERCADTPLTLGHLDEGSLREILARGGRDPLLKAIRILGPAQLLGILGEEGRSVLRDRYRSGDICTLCTDIMTNPAMVARLREKLGEDRIGRILDAAFGLECGAWPEAATRRVDSTEPEEALAGVETQA